jgi:predicted nucleic acid-binding Zn ribbon protein
MRYKTIKIDGKTVSLHRYVMACSIGHPIPAGMVVHHVNGDRLDNRIENLVTMTPQEHSEHHNQKHAKVLVCTVCGANFEPHPTKRSRQKTCSWDCRNRLISDRARARAGFVVVDGADHKPCSGCGELLPFDADNFHKSTSSRYGLMSICKPCNRARAAKRKA